MNFKEVKTKKKSESEDYKVSMDAWISLKFVEDKKLRRIQRPELEVFFKKQGLTDFENSDKYEKAYKKF